MSSDDNRPERVTAPYYIKKSGELEEDRGHPIGIIDMGKGIHKSLFGFAAVIILFLAGPPHCAECSHGRHDE
jgi:hypothetical protein